MGAGGRALRNLAVDADNQAAIAQLGGIEALLAVLARHPDAVAVQEHAVGALRSLTVNADNEAAIAQLGGIEALQRFCKHSVHSWTQCQR